MSTRNLGSLFAPKTVAVIGASIKPHSVGATVLNNLVSGEFPGAIWPVNPKYTSVAGIACVANVTSLPSAPDLAVLCTPPATIPSLIGELGARGTRAAIVLTTGLGTIKDTQGLSLRDAMLAAAKPHLLRVLGPNCVGLLVPALHLNASFAHTHAVPGKIAFVSQSGALVTAVLDWATSRGIGFSKFVSLGDSADIDVGDVLDYLAGDPDTGAILLYVEAITAARKFMSAARAASRNKPVLVVKAGRAPEGAKAATSHTGALAGADAVYDAAIHRAGMLRVLSTEDLFDAVETLARARPLRGERLAIMTNGGGPGVMAADALALDHGNLAALSEHSLRKLDAILPSTWSHGNPVDMIGDAPTARYVDTLRILLEEPQADTVLLIHAPTAIVPSDEIAAALVPIVGGAQRNVLSCWLGGGAVAHARSRFDQAGVPTYDTPEKAVRAFMQLVEYRRNQELLLEVPPSVPGTWASGKEQARAILKRAIDAGRALLSEPEAKAVLAAYAIPVVQTRVAHSADEAVSGAQAIGYPVALKVLSPQVSHKSDVGGVALDLESDAAVRAAAEAMRLRLHQLRPAAQLGGFTVQAMARRPDAHELIVGVADDAVFGPTILFGQGGIAVEVTADRAIGLPPLNGVLAHDLIARTRVSKLLAGYRNRPAADLHAIANVLIQVSHLISDLPEIAELDINPLLADADGVLALDARIRLASTSGAGTDRFAIRPYPDALEERVTWQGSPIVLRPIRPEDAAQHVAFFDALDPDDVRLRMFIRLRELPRSQLARLTQIDYDREMAFIATRERDDAPPETLGVARALADPDNSSAEFAIIVRSDLKGRGLGHLLMRKLIDYCRSRGTGEIVGEALPGNLGVLALVRRFGFETRYVAETRTMNLRLDLRAVPGR